MPDLWRDLLVESVYGPTPPVERIDLPRLYLQGHSQAHKMTASEAMVQFEATVLANGRALAAGLEEAMAKFDAAFGHPMLVVRRYTLRERWGFRWNEFMIAAGWAIRDAREAAGDWFEEYGGEVFVGVAIGLLAGVALAVWTVMSL